MTTSDSKLKKYIPKLCDREKCTGCLACYNTCKHKAIIVESDAEGFAYPAIQLDKCVGCKLCENVCPIIGNRCKNPVSDISYAAWSRDKKILRSSSSGGLYSVIGNYILQNGGVVFGAAFDDKWNVHHIGVSCEAELYKTRGSKYVASYIGTTFHDVRKLLSQGRMVLFSGTPCQVSGLNSYLNLMKCDMTKLYTIDLVCHGVPSPLIFKSYLSYLEKHNESSVKSFTFRDKRWSWFRFNCLAIFENGSRYYGKWEKDFFMRGFLREYFLRPSCHQCVYATEQRCGDFTLCDYWGYYKKQDEIDNKDMGVSLVIPNSEKAKKLFENISNHIIAYERNICEAMKSNQAFHSSFAVSPMRESFWKDFCEKGFEGVIDKYLYPEDTLPQFKKVYKYGRRVRTVIEILGRIKRKIKYFLSRLKQYIKAGIGGEA